jgi:putative peptide zinc metalloprotease protein
LPVERPTFHESWYRVADLHPKLRSTVQISRQHFRGQQWHVVQDHTNNAFFRLAGPAYRFIGLLDGKRSVGEAWNTANEQLGDDAPTQGEVIQLLGQLYTSNLLQAEVPADTHALFARYKQRKQRELTSYLMNIMFSRIPIFDPDNMLNKILPMVGWIFSPVGLVVWLILIAMGVHSIMQVPGWQSKVANQSSGLLSPDNLVLLYVGFSLIKACHEMGHAISCKKFGKQAGTGGEVHVIGIMFLVFTPVPYVDASSSWALTNKWHRAIVGAAGMWVELAIASIAAMIWANSSDGALHNFAYNIMFVAGFSTIVFNANPLLRYDGYYILSDLLEIPNLATRGKDYIYYLIKKYVWNVRFARNPAHGPSEKFWLFIYAVASFIMRMFVTLSIMFYLTGVLNGTLIILAAGMAIAGLITWAVVPTGKFIHYLATNGELSRVRSRAMLTSALAVAVLVVLIGFVPIPDHSRAQGVVEPPLESLKEIITRGPGLVTELNPEPRGPRPKDPRLERLDMPIIQAGDKIMVTDNPAVRIGALQTARAQLKVVELQMSKIIADVTPEQPFRVREFEQSIRALKEQIREEELKLERQTLIAPISGVLVAPTLSSREGMYIKQNERIAQVVDLHDLLIRVAVDNATAGMLIPELKDNPLLRRVELRVKGRADVLLSGDILDYKPAGSDQLPSPALGYQVGGLITTAADDQKGVKTEEKFFEFRVGNLKLESAPPEIKDLYFNSPEVPLLPGQRVVVRFNLTPKPIAVQAWTKFRQVFQKRFQQ